MNFRKEMHEEAVSPVIGVILMVAITVVLAAVVGMYVMNQADAIPESKTVTLTAEKSIDGTDTDIKVTVVGGSDLNAIQYLVFKWDGETVESESSNVNLVYNGKSVTTGGSVTPSGSFAPGDVVTIKKKESGKLTISGKFSDGSEALLLTKNF